PVQVLLPMTVFYRFQYLVALGLLLYGMAGGRRWLVPALLALDGLLLPETYSFSTSFMSSNCAAPLHLVYLGLLASGPRLGRREVVLLVLLNVHLLLTYPEFLAVVKCFEALQLLVAVARRRPAVWKPLLLVNLTVCLLHPVLVPQKIALTVGQ